MKATSQTQNILPLPGVIEQPHMNERHDSVLVSSLLVGKRVRCEMRYLANTVTRHGKPSRLAPEQSINGSLEHISAPSSKGLSYT